MGGDSGSAAGWDSYQTRLRKVFKTGPFLIGYTSSFRMGQLLQYKLTVPDQLAEQSDLGYLATTFIDAVRDCLRDGGYTIVNNNREEGGSFLVGYRGRLYEVADDFQVNSSQDGLMAVGCGRSYALGNLWATKDLPPRKRIKNALKAAGHFSNGVTGPYYIEEMTG